MHPSAGGQHGCAGFGLDLCEDGGGGLLRVRLLAARQPVQRVIQLPAPQVLQDQHLPEWRSYVQASD